MKYILRAYPLSLLCAAAICYLCMKRISLSGFRLFLFPHYDKAVHFLMYFVLCLLVWGERLRSRGAEDGRGRWLWTVAVPVALGGAIELAQEYLTTYRSGDWTDLAADALGVAFAVPAGLLLMPRILRKER